MGITIATGVSQWNDLSGLGNNLLQGTGASQPARTLGAVNGLPAVTFDGVDDSLSAAFALVQPLTVFCIVNQVTWTIFDMIYDGPSGTNSMALQQNTATPGVAMIAGATLGPNNNLAVGAFGLAICTFNGGTSSLQINGTAPTAGAAGAGAPAGISLGVRGAGGGNFGNVQIAECIVMAAAATAQEILNVRSYVTSRYGFAA